MNKVINAVSDYIREDLPSFRSGDTVNVGVKVVEGSKSRIQNFENYNHEGCKYYMLESDCKNFEKLERRYNLRKGDIINETEGVEEGNKICLLYTSPSPRDLSTSRMPSSA